MKIEPRKLLERVRKSWGNLWENEEEVFWIDRLTILPIEERLVLDVGDGIIFIGEEPEGNLEFTVPGSNFVLASPQDTLTLFEFVVRIITRHDELASQAAKIAIKLRREARAELAVIDIIEQLHKLDRWATEEVKRREK